MGGKIEIPHTISPTVRLPGRQRRFAAFSGTLIQRESFVTAFNRGRAASQAAISDTICTFGRGLWRVAIQLATLSTFTQASDGTVGNNDLVMVDPAGNVFSFIKLFLQANVPQMQYGVWEFLFPEDSFAFRMDLTATGVGQTHEKQITVVASRLL